MIVAYTELKDILKKVFEGMGFPWGDYEDCADDVAWMELHGWSVLDAALNGQSLTQSNAARFLYEDEAQAVIDAQNNGGLIYGSLALDLAIVKARTQPITVVKLLNVSCPQLIMPSLPHCAEQGVNALVSWQDKYENYVVFMDRQEKFPTVSIFSNATDTIDSNLVIVCGTAVTFCPSTQSEPTRVVTPTDFQENLDHRIENGILVDDGLWQQLVLRSKKILVEATEESRKKGAGENA